ncbi:MAG: MFS transporter, partial [Syntrophorhabdaceae bacterium]|nr:MFS transporter [Syntrophorhabdaceae bacterium]
VYKRQIYCLTLLFIIYGASHLPSLFSIAIIIIGIIGIFIFVYHEMRVKNPVLNIALFKNNRPFVFSNVAALIHYSASFATGFLLSFYLQFIKGFSAQSAGFVLVCQPIMMALISPLAGKASDRIEARIVASSGMALTGIGLIMLVFLKADTDLIYIITSQIIIGSGFGLFSSPNTNAVMASVGGKFYGVASSLISTMRLLGQVFNLSIVMLVFNLVIGKVGIGPSNLPQLLQAIKISFAISGGLCSIGVYTSLSRGKIGHTN